MAAANSVDRGLDYLTCFLGRTLCCCWVWVCEESEGHRERGQAQSCAVRDT